MQPSSPNSKSKEDGNISKMGTVELDAIQSKPRIQYIEGPKTMTPSLLDLNENTKTENDYDVITQTFKDKNHPMIMLCKMKWPVCPWLYDVLKQI